MSVQKSNGKGTSCHQCKNTKAIWRLFFCSNTFTRRTSSGKRVCRKKYCQSCLSKFYPQSTLQDVKSSGVCPACRSICSCAACYRKRKPKTHERSIPPGEAYTGSDWMLSPALHYQQMHLQSLGAPGVTTDLNQLRLIQQLMLQQRPADQLYAQQMTGDASTAQGYPYSAFPYGFQGMQGLDPTKLMKLPGMAQAVESGQQPAKKKQKTSDASEDKDAEDPEGKEEKKDALQGLVESVGSETFTQAKSEEGADSDNKAANSTAFRKWGGKDDSTTSPYTLTPGNTPLYFPRSVQVGVPRMYEPIQVPPFTGYSMAAPVPADALYMNLMMMQQQAVGFNPASALAAATAAIQGTALGQQAQAIKKATQSTEGKVDAAEPKSEEVPSLPSIPSNTAPSAPTESKEVSAATFTPTPSAATTVPVSAVTSTVTASTATTAKEEPAVAASTP